MDNHAILSVAAILGLMVGSFLNVVIYRWPALLTARWRADCQSYLKIPGEETSPPGLMFPNSYCPQCKTAIKPWHNIPVLSYLFLRGCCAYCQKQIPLRYPFVEMLTALVTVAVVAHWGLPDTLEESMLLTGVLVLSWGLIVLTFIDIDEYLLPDDLTLPLLWGGLLINSLGGICPLPSAVWGAIAGYLALWSLFHLFKWITGKEGMGYGDFKLLAMLGAWLGWESLPWIILLASVTGATVGVLLILLKRHHRSQPLPFGPYLSFAGWVTLLWGTSWSQIYLNLLTF